MRLIDADKLKRRTVCVMELLSEEEVSVVYSEDIDQAQTINLWHYPSKGEYPTTEEMLWNGHQEIYYDIDTKQWLDRKGLIIDEPYAWMILPELY